MHGASMVLRVSVDSHDKNEASFVCVRRGEGVEETLISRLTTLNCISPARCHRLSVHEC